jgi:hypothetical protein
MDAFLRCIYCGNSESRLDVDAVHLTGLFFPVCIRVLENAQGIYPQILETQPPCNSDGILDGTREFCDRNFLSEGSDVFFS